MRKIKSDCRHSLWLFFLAVDPQIMIYTEARQAVALLHAHGGQSSNRAHSGSSVQSTRLSAAERETTLRGNQPVEQPGFQIMKWEEARKWSPDPAGMSSVSLMLQHNLWCIFDLLHSNV